MDRHAKFFHYIAGGFINLLFIDINDVEFYDINDRGILSIFF